MNTTTLRLASLTLTALVVTASACISDQRGPHVAYAELDATKAADAKLVEVIDIRKHKDGTETAWIMDPVGSMPNIAGRDIYWMEDVKPFVAAETPSGQALQRHIAARNDAMAYDMIYNSGAVIVYGGAAASAAGLGWLLFANGGDPAFYLTLATSAATASLGFGTFATWYLLQEPHSVDARIAKIEMVEAWPASVAASPPPQPPSAE